jgi:Low psii accumulation1 / Rep27
VKKNVMMLLSIGVLLALALGSRAFAPTITFAPSRVITTTTPIRTETALFGREDDTVDQVVEGKKKTGLEDGVRTKLVAESIAPWRTVRLFLYFSLGSGAAVGGLITLSGVAAGLSGARTDLDMNTEVRNKQENSNDALR